MKLVITLDPEDVECAQDIENTTANNYMNIYQLDDRVFLKVAILNS